MRSGYRTAMIQRISPKAIMDMCDMCDMVFLSLDSTIIFKFSVVTGLVVDGVHDAKLK